MKSSLQCHAGTDCHVATTYLAVGSIFCPVVLALSRPHGFSSTMLALGIGLASLSLAWTSWKRHSNFTILSILNWPLPAACYYESAGGLALTGVR